MTDVNDDIEAMVNDIRNMVNEAEYQEEVTQHEEAMMEMNNNTGLDDVDPVNAPPDPVFQEIEAAIFARRMSEMSHDSSTSKVGGSDQGMMKTGHNFQSIPYGFQPRASYEHSKKNPNIMGVCYNGRYREFVMLDSKGVTTWSKDSVKVKDTSRRAMLYPKYEYRLITNIVYARKHNVYFALGKDFTLKVLNDKFEQTCSVSAGMRSILFMLFNPIADELITGGVDGTKVWVFEQATDTRFKEIKAMANYRLRLKYELNNVGGSWVKKVELDQVMQHLYCCSDTDLYGYDLQGNLLFSFKNAHSMSISGCVFSTEANFLLTASYDTEIKVWSLVGGHVHTFRGHSRAITHMMLHPDTQALVLTSSLDGTVRMWSLHTFEELYSMVMSSDGVLWMGLTDDHLMYVTTIRTITVWNLNYQYRFWSMSRSSLNLMRLYPGEGKTTRILTLGVDSSVRIFSRKTAQNLSTVLPPPPISPLQQIKSVTYSRELNMVYVLIDSRTLWLYTARTDPACRLAVWDTHELQEMGRAHVDSDPDEKIGDDGVPVTKSPKKAMSNFFNHRSTEQSMTQDVLSDVHCVCCLSSAAVVWTEEGECCPINDRYLLLGLEDGRILFMDPYTKGKKFMEFKANKDCIVHIEHNTAYNCLMTRCHAQQYEIIQIWDLPSLRLMHEIACDEPILAYARLRDSMMLGFESGAIELDDLDPVEDPGPLKPTVTRLCEDNLFKRRLDRNMEHKSSIIAIDSLPRKEIYASASSDGYIKIWNGEDHTLITEILLNETLCMLLFLNARGDLIFGLHNQIYILDASRVIHSMAVTDEGEDDDGNESDIYEDPYVKYENISEDPDPMSMDKYLRPYQLEFSRSFMEGYVAEPPEEEVGSEEISESEISMAPTETYFSPHQTPLTLSLLDLRMSANVTREDIRSHRRVSESSLTKELTARLSAIQKKKRKKKKRSKKPSLTDDDEDEEDEVLLRLRNSKKESIEYPQFGISPGPTPSITPPSTPPTPSEISVSEGGESTEEEVQDDKPKYDVAKKQAPVATKKKVVATTQKAREPATLDRPSGIGSVKIDVKRLMEEEKRKKIFKLKTAKVSDHDHLRKPSEKKISVDGPVDDQKVVKKMRKQVVKRARAAGAPKEEENEGGMATSLVTSPGRVEPKESKSGTKLPGSRASVKGLTRKTSRAVARDVPLPDTTQEKKLSTQEKVRKSLITGIQEKTTPTKVLLGVDSAIEAEEKQEEPVGVPGMIVEEPDKAVGEGLLDEVSSIISHSSSARKHRQPTIPERYDEDASDVLKGTNTKHVSRAWFTSEDESEDELSDSETFTGTFRSLLSASTARRRDKYLLGEDIPPRPYTVQGAPEKELEEAFESALDRYKQFQASKGEKLDLHKNDGLSFDSNWQDRMIERHLLIKMQKQIRVQSAAHRRHLLALRKQQRNKHHEMQHERAGLSIPGETSFHVLNQIARANQNSRLESRASISHRPGTAGTLVRDLPPDVREKLEKGAEQPYRLRLSAPPDDYEETFFKKKKGHKVKLHDPRDPNIFRPHSSKSIPSKCTRYVLISPPKQPSGPNLTPLEEQLLAQRFPTQHLKIYKQERERKYRDFAAAVRT